MFLKKSAGDGVGGAKDGKDAEDKPEAVFEVEETGDEDGDGHGDGCSGWRRERDKVGVRGGVQIGLWVG